MSPSASLLLLLLLGLSKAKFLPDDQYSPDDKSFPDDQSFQGKDQEDETEDDGVEVDDVDITTNILSTNNGTDIPLMEGDMLMPTNRNAIKCWSDSCLWKKSSNGQVVIPYVISNQYPADEKRKIENAMRGFDRTCIRFTPRRNEYDFISFENRQGCYSALGRQGGMQELSLSRGGCMYSGIIQHEIIHALGFQHEQTRSDRDSYVRINWQNIVSESAYNFYKHDTNNQNTPYDYGSIMHYGRTAFAVRDGLETITPTFNPSAQIGQRQALSRWDIQRINLLYRC